MLAQCIWGILGSIAIVVLFLAWDLRTGGAGGQSESSPPPDADR
jgi:hypothetical protein